MQKDYKDTLILPQTNFPMKANLPQKEQIRYKQWENYAYKTMSHAATKTHFTLHDGPPYANGNLHVGHAINKILKDFVVKYHYFKGKQVFYTPGWDCHGLPIEQQVANTFESQNIVPTKIEIRKACREHAEKFVAVQKEEFLSMGIVGDFSNPYKTMNYHFEADIYRALVKIANNGLLTQRSKPIFWSWAAKSALAEAEVEYKNKKSDSIFVKFPLATKTLKALGLEEFNTKESPFVIIWTTTPWTLPSNIAISLKPNEAYVLISNGAIVAKKLYESLRSKSIIHGEIIHTLDSKQFENLIAINPLNDRESVFILADFVSMEDGTGMVHSAPGHGEEDYFACLRYNLPVIMAVDDGGHFDDTIFKHKLFKTDIIQEFLGMHIFKAQKKILEILSQTNALLFHEEIIHSYPHCWRTNKPVIFRATKQWFILMDKPFHNGKTLREVALEEIEKTRFYPENGRNRLKTMVENRPDWCISRQREWGVPIAFFMDKQHHEPLLDSEVTTHIANLFEQYGCDIWWEKDIVDLLPQSHKHKAHEYTKNTHILDVWFDSGSTWFAVLQSQDYHAGNYPSSLYLEGSDQHRGWFQSSLLVSCALNHKAPFEGIITHGFITDDKGEKMSKSKGNVLTPNSIISQNGSEILRLWVALSDYQNDVKISPQILKQVGEHYLKLRNTIRFLLANTQGLKKLDFSHLSAIDVWILEEAKKVFSEIDDLFSHYEFSKGFQILNGFITAILSGIYLDICKDSLYCDNASAQKRIAIQSVFALLANRVLHILSPFLTYTIDEALEYAECVIKEKAQNVFELQPLEFPKLESYNYNMQDFTFLLHLRRLLNENIDTLKKEKKVKSSLELEIHADISCKDKAKLIEDFLMVSACNISNTTIDNAICSIQIGEKQFQVSHSHNHKCPRCWQFKALSPESLCTRCTDVLANV